MSELVDDAIFANERGYPVWCPRCQNWFDSMETPCPDCGWPQVELDDMTLDGYETGQQTRRSLGI